MKNIAIIREKLSDQHKSFLKYCQESGKNFIEELDREDFIAYRSEYAAPRESVAQIKKLLNFQEHQPIRKMAVLQKNSAIPLLTSRKYYSNDRIIPYENIFITERDLNSRAELDEAELTKNLPERLDEKLFEETVVNLAREKNCSVELMWTELSKIYKHSGTIFHRDKLSIDQFTECDYILKARFRNGYKIGDESFYQRFARYFQEIFKRRIPLTRHALDNIIKKIGVLRDQGKYIHPDYVHVSSSIIAHVRKIIDDSDCLAFSYKAIFETHESFFMSTPITNPYFLKGVLKFYKLPYTFKKDYLTKTSEDEIITRIDTFIIERGEIDLQAIKGKFLSFDDKNMTQWFARCPKIIRIGDGTFLHTSQLTLSKEELVTIKNFLHQKCSTPISSRRLFDSFFEQFIDFMNHNNIYSHVKLFAILQHLFQGEFNFSRSYISTTDIKNLNNKKLFLQIFGSSEEIKIEESLSVCAAQGILFPSKANFIESLRPEFIRVSKSVLRRLESIGITEKIISSVAKNLRSALERNDGWLTAQTFDEYEWLPRLKTSWNSFLLESVAALAGNPRILKNPSASRNFSSAIFVSEKFSKDDFQSFLKKILYKEHTTDKPFRSEREIFNWLKRRGLCSNSLPKFLKDSRTFNYLSEYPLR